MKMQVKRGGYGFTLVELLMVIAIIAILSSILFPVFGQAREKARQSLCISNLRQLGMAAMLYAQDYDERMPNAQWIGPAAFPPNWSFGLSSRDLLEPYVKNNGVFTCPSDTELSVMLVRSAGKPFGLSYQFHGNPLGHGNNIVKQVYFNDPNGKPMREPENSVPLSWQEQVGKKASPVTGTALSAITHPADTWAFADAWPGVHGGELTSYFAGTRSYMLTAEDRPFRRGVNLVYVDGHTRYNNAVAAAWETVPY